MSPLSVTSFSGFRIHGARKSTGASPFTLKPVFDDECATADDQEATVLDDQTNKINDINFVSE